MSEQRGVTPLPNRGRLDTTPPPHVLVEDYRFLASHGETSRHIADRLGLHHDTLLTLLHRHGVGPQHPGIPR